MSRNHPPGTTPGGCLVLFLIFLGGFVAGTCFGAWVAAGG